LLLTGSSLQAPPPRLERASARDHALGCRGRQSSDAQINDLLDRESVRQLDRLHTAVAAGGEQFDRAAAVGLGAAAGSRHWRVIGWRLF
jgi:hypothetical protein